MSRRRNGVTTRRRFLQAATTASLALPGLAFPSFGDSNSPPRGTHNEVQPGVREGDSPSKQIARSEIKFPRIFTGRSLSRISFPLGGIGTGGIGLGGRGNLMDWEIFNRPSLGNVSEFASFSQRRTRTAFPALWVKSGNSAPKAAILERRLLPPYDLTPEGLGSDNAPGLPRLAEATFFGSFPLAKIEFHDHAVPVEVSLEAFSSFQPVDADLSGLPCAVLSYEVLNPEQQEAEVVIAWCVENPITDEGHPGEGSGEPGKNKDHRSNEIRRAAGMQGILLTNPSLADDHPLKGSLVLAVIDEGNDRASVRRYWRENPWNAGIQRFWFDEFSKTGELGQEVEPYSPVGTVALRKTIPAGESRKYRFLLSWHFPNRTPARCGWEAPKGKEKAFLGNYYCTRFSDAWAVAEYVQQNLGEIEEGTRGFVQVLQSSTLPPEVIEAGTANLPTLVSNTSFRIANGSFHGFEGCGDSEGWGFGTCSHVWNYEVATQFLFPVLAQSIRNTSFGYATDADGHMDFRHKLPLGEEHWGAAAADGQMGQIIKLSLDWKLSGDNAWLRQLWPGCRRALSYAWRPGGWDGDKDGVMEGVQHNTYDIEFYGPNPMCESWYLAALKAAAEMATAMADAEFAAVCQRLYEQGSRWMDAHLFNGEYYLQQVRGIPENQIAEGLREGDGAKDTVHPDYQAGSGCLLDQLLGQYMADLAGLGPLLNIVNIRKSLESIYRYNYKRDLSEYASDERTFALNDEASLVLCDYPKGGRPEIPFPYDSENFTGSEYAAANLMLKYGMVEQGVECIANIRKRYDGERANPYNEAEWGRHYARAMASWGAIPVLSGFSYNGLTQELEVKPLVSTHDFRCFWSTPTAWGNLQQTVAGEVSKFLLKPTRGSIAIRQLKLDPKIFSRDQASVAVGDRRVPCVVNRRGNSALLILDDEVRISPAAALTVAET